MSSNIPYRSIEWRYDDRKNMMLKELVQKYEKELKLKNLLREELQCIKIDIDNLKQIK